MKLSAAVFAAKKHSKTADLELVVCLLATAAMKRNPCNESRHKHKHKHKHEHGHGHGHEHEHK